jgi:uncharacterized protein (DUF1800 family)
MDSKSCDCRGRVAGLATSLVLVAAALVGCGGSREAPAASAAAVAPVTPAAEVLSTGQVAPAAAASQVSVYAASRFAEQVSFGPTPALVAEIRAKGYAKWIDEQLAMAPTLIDMKPFEGYPENEDPGREPERKAYYAALANTPLAAPDQLRWRVTWSLSQIIVVSYQRIDTPGAIVPWVNMLHQHGLGGYDELLYQTSIHATMGSYLDNAQNRPKSAECRHCAPNENYARELMQLFALGVYKLNPDGTPQRDPRGRLIETYSQRDVEELARVLTGWRYNPTPAVRPGRNHGNWMRPMVPSTWPPERDSGAKTVMGKTFPGGQTAPKDLRDAVDMLMSHPNIAPFVTTRLIQHLVKSNPTPAYVQRMVGVFVNNGSGVRGDMKAVVKAILLDAEARAGDNPAAARADDGKLREPFLHRVAMWRSMGCSKFPTNYDGWPLNPELQTPLQAESVFSFYAPTDRAPGSNLLAPEQSLLISRELQSRLSQQEHGRRYNSTTRLHEYQTYLDAGCPLDDLSAKLKRSPAEFVDLLSQRYFRGAMPPTLRSNLEQIARLRNPPWNVNDPHEGTLRLIGYALATPYFGASK